MVDEVTNSVLDDNGHVEILNRKQNVLLCGVASSSQKDNDSSIQVDQADNPQHPAP